MAHWHEGRDGSRWRLEESPDRDIMVVSFPSWEAAKIGIPEREARGAMHIESIDVGRIEARFRLPELTADTLIGQPSA